MQFPIDLKFSLLNYLKYDDLIHAFEIFKLSENQINKYLENRLVIDFLGLKYRVKGRHDFSDISDIVYLYLTLCLKYKMPIYVLYKMMILHVKPKTYTFDPDAHYLIICSSQLAEISEKYFERDFENYIISLKSLIELYILSGSHSLLKFLIFPDNFPKSDSRYFDNLAEEISTELYCYYAIIDQVLSHGSENLSLNGEDIIVELLDRLSTAKNNHLLDVVNYISQEISANKLSDIMRKVSYQK